MSNITIEVDTTELRKAFKAAPMIVTTKVNGWIYKTTMMTEREAKIQESSHVDTGQLQSSIHSRIGNLMGEVKPTAKHAIFVHEGRKPGSKMPPFGEGTALNSWARRKGIPSFLVARSIAKKGIKATPFMDMAFKIVKPKAERNAQTLLSEIVGAI